MKQRCISAGKINFVSEESFLWCIICCTRRFVSIYKVIRTTEPLSSASFFDLFEVVSTSLRGKGVDTGRAKLTGNTPTRSPIFRLCDKLRPNTPKRGFKWCQRPMVSRHTDRSVRTSTVARWTPERWRFSSPRLYSPWSPRSKSTNETFKRKKYLWCSEFRGSKTVIKGQLIFGGNVNMIYESQSPNSLGIDIWRFGIFFLFWMSYFCRLAIWF